MRDGRTMPLGFFTISEYTEDEVVPMVAEEFLGRFSKVIREQG